MTVAELKNVENTWATAKTFLVVTTPEQYTRALDLVETLMAEIPDTQEDHPLFDLLQTLAALISNYEDHHFKMESVPSNEVLKFLMEQHNLKQADLPELGSQGVVSEILSAKRQLNIRQINFLCERFKTSPNVFFPSPLTSR